MKKLLAMTLLAAFFAAVVLVSPFSGDAWAGSGAVAEVIKRDCLALWKHPDMQKSCQNVIPEIIKPRMNQTEFPCSQQCNQQFGGRNDDCYRLCQYYFGN